MDFRKITFFALFFILILSACGEEVPENVPPQSIITDAEKVLSEKTGVPIDELIFKEVEDYVWPDLCLGLPEQGEMCAQVTTEGWRFIYDVNGEDYEVRTDEAGVNVRIRKYNSEE
jgi:hypothetical protein